MDDPKGKDVATVIGKTVKLITVGSNVEFDYHIKSFSYNDENTEIIINNRNKEYKILTKMKGDFNITNIALAFAVSNELGIKIDEINKKLVDFEGIEGRFQIVLSKPFTVIIDYAHTPVSLENILHEARKISKNRVVVVFGCTGDRDKEKRSIMGEVAAKNADFTYITNDDPYSEEPEDIAAMIKKGFDNLNKEINKDYEIILDRRKAISKALKKAEKDDVIVIAGMGHQKVQYIKDKVIQYNDKDTVLELIKKLGH
jgi:UDP-N-acetylmuramoyl-L-alanyl-D-glutamate--2,6-diaminopimelate ligase